MGDEQVSVRTVGFVGLGNIGRPMATALTRRFPVVVHDVDPARAGSVPAARGLAGLAQVARSADVVGVAVYDDAQVTEVVAGLLAAGGRCHSILVHSTVRPDTVRRLAALAADAGVSLLDVAVAGGDARAAAGELTLMVGGEVTDVARVQPVLDALGNHVFHVGRTGAGLAAKLANNLVLHVGFAALEEALRLGRQAGIAEPDLLAVLRAGTARSWLTENLPYYRDQVRRVLPPDLIAKDLTAALRLAPVDLDVPLTRLAACLAAGPERGTP